MGSNGRGGRLALGAHVLRCGQQLVEAMEITLARVDSCHARLLEEVPEGGVVGEIGSTVPWRVRG
jgi:hypothetical protein